MAQAEPQRWVVIDAGQPPDAVQAAILNVVLARLKVKSSLFVTVSEIAFAAARSGSADSISSGLCPASRRSYFVEFWANLFAHLLPSCASSTQGARIVFQTVEVVDIAQVLQAAIFGAAKRTRLIRRCTFWL